MNPGSTIPARIIPGYGSSIDLRALAGIVALHVVLALGLLSLEPVARSVGLSQPLMVSLLSAPEPEPPSASPEPTRPRAREHPPLESPVMAVREVMPAATLASAQPPESIPVSNLSPESAPTKPAEVAAAASPAPVATIVPPRFGAAYLDNPAPSYPALSRRLREHGSVLLRVFVNPEGRAAQVVLLTSSGYQRLDHAAQEVVLRWRFLPARQGERLVADWVQVPIEFLPPRS